MAEAKKRFENLSKIKSGTTPSSDLKMKDILAVQHMDATSGTNTLNQISVAQNMCQPIARCSGTPNDGAYVADCINFPDFSLTYTDSQSNQYYLYGLKIRVIFEDGITYGSVDSGTYPTLNINNSGAIPLLAQGLTMAQGAAVAGQSLEFTLIPYGQNGVAWDADTNIRENTSDYTIYTDGSKIYSNLKVDNLLKALRFASSDKRFNIDTDTDIFARSYASSQTTGICPSNYGIVLNFKGEDNSWKWQIALSTYTNVLYRQNINFAGWTNWTSLM